MPIVLAAAAAALDPWSYLGYFALAAAGFFVLFGARSNQSKKDLQESVVALQGALDARKDESDRQRVEIDRLQAENRALNTRTGQLQGAIATLERVVTGEDAIKELSKIVRVGFEHQGVPAELLAAGGGG